MIESKHISSEERELYSSKRDELALQFADSISKLVQREQKKEQAAREQSGLPLLPTKPQDIDRRRRPS